MPNTTALKSDNGLAVFVKHTFINAQLDDSDKTAAVRKYSIPSSFRFEQHELLDASLRSGSKLSDASSGSNPAPRAPSRSSPTAGSRPNQQGNQSPDWEPSMRFKYDFAKVMNRSMKILESSELIAHVQVSESSHECLVNIQLSDQGSFQKEKALAFAQKALLDGAVPSKSIFVLGFRSAFPFVPTALGFDGKFVAMENATTACWHLFKKGFCRHGNACRNRHPTWAKAVRVVIEASPSDTQNTFAGERDVKSEI